MIHGEAEVSINNDSGADVFCAFSWLQVRRFKRCKCEAGLLTFTCELSEGTGVWIKKFLQWNKHNYRSSKSLELKFQQPISCSEYLIVGKYV